MEYINLKRKIIIIITIVILFVLAGFTIAAREVSRALRPKIVITDVIEVKGERYADVSYAGSCFVPAQCVFKNSGQMDVVYTVREGQDAFGKPEYFLHEVLLYRIEDHEDGIKTISSYDMSYFGEPIVYSASEQIWDGAAVDVSGEYLFEMDLGEWWVV